MPSIQIRVFICVLTALSLCAAGAYAERADRERDLRYEADEGKLDDVNQVMTLAGSAVITKGTLVVRAQRIEIRQDASGYDFKRREE